MSRSRPIIFSGPMVRAIIAGRKTQTRRVARNAHIITVNGRSGVTETPCPFGRPGDGLWVRESWYYDVPPHRLEGLRDVYDIDSLYFRADGECCEQIPECSCAEVGKPKWQSPIHLPAWAARLHLRIKSIRVEALSAITEADAIAEGVQTEADHYGDESLRTLHGSVPWHRYDEKACAAVSARESFRTLWESIHGAESWDSDTWVWAIEFEVAGGANVKGSDQ